MLGGHVYQILESVQILCQRVWGGGGLIQNADTADTEDKMLTLGSGGVWKLGLRAEIKRKWYK